MILFSGSGALDYTPCVAGCTFKTDDNIALTFPEKMHNKDLIPINEIVS